MPLMRLTPMWKSKYCWLAWVAFELLYIVLLLAFGPVTIIGRLVCLAIAAVAYFPLIGLAEKAQLEADWEIPQTPRIKINE